MSFKLYIFLVFLACLFLFTPMWEGACVAITCLICVCAPMSTFNYKSWKKSQKRSKKSLSFAIVSMEQQKNNFRIINSIFLKDSLRRVFKKLSVAFDAMPTESTYNWDTSSSSCTAPHHPSSAAGVYVTNPLYSHMSCNINHRD